MATISIHIQDDLLDELNKRSTALNVSKAEYIRRAIIAMNIQADRICGKNECQKRPDKFEKRACG